MARNINNLKLFRTLFNQTKHNWKNTAVSEFTNKTSTPILNHNRKIHSQYGDIASSFRTSNYNAVSKVENILPKVTGLPGISTRNSVQSNSINPSTLPFNHQQCSAFSVFSSLNAKKKEKCKRPKPKERAKYDCPKLPPCLKFVRPPGRMKKYDTKALECGRICMPCCPPARFPPICYFPHDKKKCEKVKNPRPAYSECPKDCIGKIEVCDCCSIKPPPCKLLPDIEDEC